jgi:hypothetical protein
MDYEDCTGLLRSGLHGRDKCPALAFISHEYAEPDRSCQTHVYAIRIA